MKGKYKKTQEWCKGCDKELVTIGKKCSICKTINKQKSPTLTSTELINNLWEEYEAFYCQREFEFKTICDKQCRHCKIYYYPLKNN